ncbi:MAG: glycosyl hydrolase family 17 protein [Bacteroidota bacterium]
MKNKIISGFIILILGITACTPPAEQEVEAPKSKTAAEILGNPDYQAISYGGYRQNNRDEQPSIDQLKEDMKILHAMGIRIFRTYNTHLPHARNVLTAIQSLKKEDPNFEMYVMLGVWINCKGAFVSDNPNHEEEDAEANAAEVQRAVDWALEYPDIIKVIAVGNEAMVKWATSYFVQPGVILKWVNHLQDLKEAGTLPADLWITSSDNFASWGGGGAEYHVEDLEKLIRAVDYISLHTYPMHDTHYNPAFWGTSEEGTDLERVAVAMEAAKNYAIKQYEDTKAYIRGLGVESPIHIGETGWASFSNGFYGDGGSRATDEYKEALYYHSLKEWTDAQGISCFYFEAFDENWKDAANPGGSENHFGLFTIDGKAKYVIWDLVDQGIFEGLGRSGNPITKTYDGDEKALLQAVKVPPLMNIAVE